ncbi:polysaccharide biosynthesis tyrosine autokinase [Caulobacter sp. S45]|uniref:GumC family protein n=1 Tax=Caulobacter sp. S45 TaxID=1641861 RepID=UPI00131D6BC7|nr:polysaccharide biosynthesis tyrosine autokinase [Caulobacter sp. S45]
MNSISPQMLRVASGAVTLATSSGLIEDRGPGRPLSLKRLLHIVLRWRWVFIGGVASGAVLGVVVTLLTHHQYTSTERLQISRETAQVVNIGAISRDVSIGDQEFYQTQYGLMRTQSLAERVARDIGVIDDPAFFKMFGKSDAFAETSGAANHVKRTEAAGLILLAHVVVAPTHGSSLVDVAATTPSPELSAKLAQRWSEDFIASTLERRREGSDYARRYLETRIDQLREKLESSERRAADYAAAQGIIDLPTTGDNSKVPGADPDRARSLVTDDLIATNSARNGAAAERIQAASRLAAASDQPGASADALNYRAIGLLRDKRADAAADYAKAVVQLPAGDPATKAAHAQVEALDTAIQGEQNRVRTALQQTYQAASSREKALTQRVNALKGSLADQRQRAIQYNIYQRDAETNRELYEGLLQRYKEIGVAGSADNNNVAVVDAAKLPSKPSSPHLTINILLFTLAGGAIALAAIAVLEKLEDGVAEPEECLEKLGLPLLGVAPKLKVQTPLEAMRDPQSPLAESYLVVTANLKLAASKGVSHSLAVLSTRPKEGKSTTAVALARGLARAQRTVVLVDASLRSPSIHATFGLKNTSGVSDFLMHGDDIETILRPTEFKGLSVVTAGARAPNPADLLIGDGLARLVQALQNRFDHVIIDGPAVIDLADAPLVASAVESVIYVVASRSVPAASVRAALGRLDRAQVLGGVLTMFATNPVAGRRR